MFALVLSITKYGYEKKPNIFQKTDHSHIFLILTVVVLNFDFS
jgi:hypothetical protein